MTEAAPQWVSVIAPCRNERAAIDAFCDSALAQQLPPGWQLEVLVADGRSDDPAVHATLARVFDDAISVVSLPEGRVVVPRIPR